MEFNLRPAKVVRRHQLAEKRTYLVLASICLLLALAVWWLYFQKSAEATEKAIAGLDPKVTELQGFERKINAAKTDIKNQQEGAKPLLLAVDERSYWVGIIDDINSRLPKEYVWVTSFDLKPAEKVLPPKPGAVVAKAPVGPILLLKGLYLYNEKKTQVVDDFVNKLTESPLYTVDKDNLKRSVENDQYWAYEYEIPLILKAPGDHTSPPSDK